MCNAPGGPTLILVTHHIEEIIPAVTHAMASGKAVVAMNEGECLETVVDGSTGLLVKPDVDDIINAINKISKEPSMFKDKCIEQAGRFNVDVFMDKMKKTINELMIHNTKI